MVAIKVPSNRWVGLTGKIDDASVAGAIEKITNLHQIAPAEPICLFISSGGGSCRVGFTFCEYILHALKPTIYTVVTGEAGSMAVPIFLVGSKRFMTTDSTLFLHEITRSFDSNEALGTSELTTCLSRLSIDRDKYIKLIAERSETGITEEKLLELMQKNTTLTATEAVKLGLAHFILR